MLWPGGVRNKLYDVEPGEKLTFPHIPCSYDDDWPNIGQYNRCVLEALNKYRRKGEINDDERRRLRLSARRAFMEARP